MKRMNRRVITYLFLLFLFVVILFISFFPYKTALVFYEENTNNIAAYLPIQVGENFQVVFTHSIHLTDVIEKYQVTEQLHIKQYEFIFEEFGIGMPSNASEGETFVYENGKYHIRNINREFSSINIRNGKTVPRHRLIWGDEAENMIWFNAYFEHGAWFTMKVEKLSIWEFMIGEKIDE